MKTPSFWNLRERFPGAAAKRKRCLERLTIGRAMQNSVLANRSILEFSHSLSAERPSLETATRERSESPVAGTQPQHRQCWAEVGYGPWAPVSPDQSNGGKVREAEVDQISTNVRSR